MRLAAIADVYGTLPALEAVLADLRPDGEADRAHPLGSGVAPGRGGPG